MLHGIVRHQVMEDCEVFREIFEAVFRELPRENF